MTGEIVSLTSQAPINKAEQKQFCDLDESKRLEDDAP